MIWVAARDCAATGGCTGEVPESVDGGASWHDGGVGSALAGQPGGAAAFTVAGVSATTAGLVVPGRLPYRTGDVGRTWRLAA